jgi:Ser/Thr protein kinase RdoA (MazF antagonist)
MTTTLHTSAPAAERGSRDDAVKRIAAALGVATGDVALSRCATNARGTAAHWYGRWGDTPIFAKTLIGDAFPACDPLWNPALDTDREARTSAGQVDTEWSAAQRLAPLDGSACGIPQRLARGRETLVWRQAPGRTLDSLILRSRISGHARERVAAALCASGAWLRRVHDTFMQGSETLDLQASARATAAGAAAPRTARAAWRKQAAVDLLTLAASKLPRGCTPAPRSFTHGDLTPPNIVYDARTAHVTVVDLEHAAERTIVRDLVVVVSRLRSRRLHPLVPDACVETYERAFWDGYGQIARDLRIATSALASAWLFHAYPARPQPRASGRRAALSLYDRLFASGREQVTLRAMRLELEEL